MSDKRFFYDKIDIEHETEEARDKGRMEGGVFIFLVFALAGVIHLAIKLLG